MGFILFSVLLSLGGGCVLMGAIEAFAYVL